MTEYAFPGVFASVIVALVYGLYAGWSVLSLSPGNEKMQSIAAAIEEGAAAYMNRQYLTVAFVGIALFVIIGVFLGWVTASGFLVGAVLSALAGFIGMYVSVRANVRTAE